jgi:hypothetical protein
MPRIPEAPGGAGVGVDAEGFGRQPPLRDPDRFIAPPKRSQHPGMFLKGVIEVSMHHGRYS